MDNSLLTKVLELIDYKGNKEEFINLFLNFSSVQAISSLIQSLSQDKQEEVKDIIKASGVNPEKINDSLKAFFTEEQIKQALETSAQKAISEYIVSLAPTLTEEQKAKLLQLSKNFQTTS